MGHYLFQLYMKAVLLFKIASEVGLCEGTTIISVNEGKDVTLPCEYTHPEPDPPPSVIEWLRQERELPVFIKIGKYPPHVDPSFSGGRMSVKSGKADLTIKRVEIRDEGWYECRVIFLQKEDNNSRTNGGGRDVETPRKFINGTWVKLLVTAPPFFKLTPRDTTTLQEGDVLLLRCRAQGRPTPVITWLKDGWPIKNGQDGIRLSEGELAVASVKKIHKGKYSCRAQNVEGLIEQSTTVYVKGAPVFVTLPRNVTVNEGQDATYLCKAEGYPTDIEYSWFYNDEPVETSEKLRGRYGTLGEGSLMIYNVFDYDGGVVTCRADNGYGKAPVASATLTVQFAARVTKMPSILYAGLGLKTSLPCPAVAVPPVSTVTWHKNGMLLTIDQDRRYSYGENGSLIIKGVAERDAAKYTCTPYNILGTRGASTEARLIVRYPPYFINKPRDEYQAEIGKKLIIPCEGAGDPPPHISWIKLDDNGVEEEILDKDERLLFTGSNLTIHPVIKSDHGRWQCVLSNAVASVRADSTVFVKYTTPHAVTNISVIASRHSALISWTAGYNGGYPQYFMIWYKRADMGDHSWQTQSVERYRKMATVSNLDADSIYQFALLPENILGSGQFSKTVTARTKEIPPPRPTPEAEPVPSPSCMDFHVTDEELLLLMWQPPLDTNTNDLLGYVVEFRMLLEEKDDKQEEDSPTTTASTEITAAPSRSKRSLMKWNRIVFNRIRRDAVPSAETSSPIPEREKWSSWDTLAPVSSNATELTVAKDKLFRDQMYMFQVFAVLKTGRSSPPSAPLTVSTKGMDAYPMFRKSRGASSAKMNPAVVAGIVSGIIFVAIMALLTSLWCHSKHRRKSALGTTAFTFGSLDEDEMDSKSRSKPESPSVRSVESRSSGKDKTGPLSKLKKKMLKADVEMGNAYSSSDQLVSIPRKGSMNKQSADSPDSGGQTLIRKISRASDGKFHVSDQSSVPSDSAFGVGESDSLISGSKSGKPLSGNSGHSFASRSRSAEWDAKSPLLQQATASTNGSESLEIDCSHSDIEVRYVKDARGKGRFHSTSTSSLVAPRLYDAPRREMGPFESSADSSMADSAYPAAEYQQQPGFYAPGARQNMMSPAPVMPPYSQYVQMRGHETPGRAKNAEYRLSSPPRFQDYNPTPGNPPKYRYHKHVEQPGGHYHVSPRDSYTTSPTERLVYDPRYTRIEPIFEVGYRPNQPPNRHSSFVIDTRRELPNHPHPHRAIQIYRTNPQRGGQDGVDYPAPTWRDQSGSQYHTLPHPTQMSSAPHNFQIPIDQNSVEASLIRHNANALRSPSHGEGSFNSNSLGRPRRKSGNSPRRRVRSVDDLTRDAVSPSDDNTIIAEKSGSVDLLSPRQSRPPDASPGISAQTTLSKDRTKDGCEAEDEASDVTVSSAPSSSRVPSSAVTARNAGPINDQETNVVAVVTSAPTSPRGDDSSAVSSLVHSSREHRPLEVTSSGYDSHNTSHTSESPAPSCSSPNATIRPSPHDHDRASTASSSDRSRKDTSSVDEKYEWDSEIAMETEILEALRHFGTHKRAGSVSQALVDEIQKLGMDKLHTMGKDEFANLEKAVASRPLASNEDDDDTDRSSTTVDTSDMYTKESMERRCAALKKEYQRYQMEQLSLGQSSPTDKSVFSSSAPAANA